MEGVCAEQVGKTLGWSPSFIEIVAKQTFHALLCKSVSFNDCETSLPPLLDLIWHEMILETKDYREFCRKHFGKFLEHSKKSSEDDLEIKNKRIDALASIWSNLFPSVPMDPECWRREQGEPLRKKIKSKKGPEKFRVSVKSLNNKIVQYDLIRGCSVGTLIGLISFSQGIPIDQQRLIFAGKEIHTAPEKTLDVRDESLIHLVLKLRGC